jgi:hypothetical protein
MNTELEPPDEQVLRLFRKSLSLQRSNEHKQARLLLVRVAKHALSLTAHPNYLNVSCHTH